MNKRKLILALIIVLALFLRVYKLESYPALNADEAAIGYNVYSLIETGMDEHGNAWPIHFQSFNDFKPGLYFYTILPFVKYFGLNEWTVRLPGALIGVASVYFVYLFVKELFKKSDFDNELLAIISSLFLAISPWHIHFSRGGWEVNLATFLMLAGAYFFVKRKDKNLILSAVLFAMSLYAYHAARVVVPLFVLGLAVLNAKHIKNNYKKYFVAGVVGLIILIPLVRDFSRPEISSRAAGVGLFADVGPLTRINEQRGEHGNYNSVFAKALHNKAVNYTLAFMENWTDHYHGEFLFLSGDEIQRNKVPETGQMYMIDILFVLVGLYVIIRKPKYWWTILLWLFVAPTAAALTFQSPHALRSHNLVIPFVIISAFGLLNILNWGKEKLRSKNILLAFYSALVILIGWSFLRYEHMYWVHMGKEYEYATQWGMEELVSFVEENEDNYEKVIVTDDYDQPYIHFLFYMKYPPSKFQGNHSLSSRDEFGFSTVREFDKYLFMPIDFDQVRPNYSNALIIGTDEEIPDEANIIKNIYFPNGEPAFQIVAN